MGYRKIGTDRKWTEERKVIHSKRMKFLNLDMEEEDQKMMLWSTAGLFPKKKKKCTLF